MKLMVTILFLLLFETLSSGTATRCDRTPDQPLRPKNTEEIDKYIIEISGDPSSYIPDQTYKVTLTYNPILDGVHMFREFMLSLERETDDAQSETDNSKVGYLRLTNDFLSTYSRKCENTIFQTSSIPKPSIQVYWVAPPSGSGCIALRATVVESKENWYSDDGSLTKILCEEESENEDVQPSVLDECCACDEAKYELVFEGLWTRNTHPKDYPSNIWYTKFGDIVGASHINDESFWKYGDLASENLKALGENGDTSGVERQLKQQVGKTVRTIIKANGLRYPNITGKTFTFFRVDQNNHLVSIVTKITPSPDWILGVSSFELCLKDCSWVEQRILNLYPWDIGTDEGISYNSVNEPSDSPTVIHSIKTDDEKSPFYDPEGKGMKPFAKLYFNRIKTYRKDCEKVETETSTVETTTIEGQSENCSTTDWFDWSPCSETCGKGFQYRQKELIFPENREVCSVKLVDQRECVGKKCENNRPELLPADDPKCALHKWGAWSSCSVECGKGTMTRDKKFVHPGYAAQCENNDPSVLQQNEDCQGEKKNCTPEYTEECFQSSWGPWTPCNVTCGSGTKIRLRMPDSNEEDETAESECKNMEQVTCYEPLCIEEETTNNSFGFITSLNQLTTENIFSEPIGPVANCKVSKWSLWGPCELIDGNCGKGYKTQHRQILQHAMNGGKSCPRKLMRKKRCYVSCQKEQTEDSISTTTEAIIPSTTEVTTEESVDCVMSAWSQWSPCSLSCGSSAVQQRTRSIKRHPQKGGKPCGPRLDQKPCPLPLACSDKGMPVL